MGRVEKGEGPTPLFREPIIVAVLLTMFVSLFSALRNLFAATCHPAMRVGAESRDGDLRQLSFALCCRVDYYVSAVGLTLAALLYLVGVTRHRAAYGRAVGRPAAAAVAALSWIAAPALAAVAVADTCTHLAAHKIAAAAFFLSGSGVVAAGALPCRASPDGGTTVPGTTAARRSALWSGGDWPIAGAILLKPAALACCLAALPVAVLYDAYLGEWLAIAAVDLGAVAVQCDATYLGSGPDGEAGDGAAGADPLPGGAPADWIDPDAPSFEIADHPR